MLDQPISVMTMLDVSMRQRCVCLLPHPEQDFQLSLPQYSSIHFELLHFCRWAAGWVRKCSDYLAQREVFIADVLSRDRLPQGTVRIHAI